MKWRRRKSDRDLESAKHRPTPTVVPPVPIAANDAALSLFASATGPVDLNDLELDTPAVRAMREAGVELVVPLVAQGELIGLLNLGSRLSEQPYSTDDRRLLASLASQAAPALRVAQLVRQQEEEARQRERVDAELRVAQLIQQNFLPRDVSAPTGWDIDAFYRPAREVGGDFYDVLDLPDGRVGLVIGDVTDKGVPAALVMASTRSVLRAAAQRITDPAKVLERVNEQLVPDIPEAMFVTCLYGVLDPTDGTFRFANAGHNLPSVVTNSGVVEPRATGMPLGLVSGSTYDENEITVEPGGSVLLYSDALPEAHAPDGQMLGFPGVHDAVASVGSRRMVDHLMETLDAFTGPDWEQEDDLTFLVLRRAPGVTPADATMDTSQEVILDLEIASKPDGERDVARQVSEAASDLGLSEARARRLESGVGESVMNAMEHGNQYRDDLRVRLRLLRDGPRLTVEIRDAGLSGPIPENLEEPNLDAKLRGEEPARGWGLFLTRSMVDELHTSRDEEGNTTVLVMRLEDRDV